MFIASLFLLAKKGKLPESSSIDEWINKMWYIRTIYVSFSGQPEQISTNWVVYNNRNLFSDRSGG